MSKKSVSLFEVLPPSQASKKQEAASANSSKAPAPSKTEPVAKARQSVSMENDAAAPAETSSKSYHYSNPNTSSKVKSHSVEGVSVREKSDPFFLVLVCMVVLSIVSGLAGYKFGYQKGVEQGASITLDQKSNQALPARPSPKTVDAPKSQSAKSKMHQASLNVSVLPTKTKKLTPEQNRATIPPEELKKYTLQVQTFGRKYISEAKKLVSAFKAEGYDSFYDSNDGAVLVGRFKSYDSSEAKQLKNAVLRFNWRSRDFSKSYFRFIPKHLLEP